MYVTAAWSPARNSARLKFALGFSSSTAITFTGEPLATDVGGVAADALVVLLLLADFLLLEPHAPATNASTAQMATVVDFTRTTGRFARCTESLSSVMNIRSAPL